MSDSQKWLLLAGVAGTGVLIYLLAPVFTPFLVSALLAYLGDPLADRLQRLGLSRTLAVVVVFVLLLVVLALLLLLLVPLVERQIAYLLSQLPAYMAWLQDRLLPWVTEHLGLEGVAIDAQTLAATLREHWQQAGGVAVRLLGSVSTSGAALLAWLANLVLIPVVTFYLLRDWDRLAAHLHGLVPRRMERDIARLARESDGVLSAFLRGQFLVMLALAAIYTLGLWVVGLQLALLIGVMAGLVSFVPYLGTVLGIVAAGVAIVVQTHDPFQLVAVLAVFGVGQLLEGMVLTPWLVGDRIGLHPVAVIFAVLAGGQLFGFTGVLLALPAAAVLAVLARHAHERYLGSTLYEEGK